MDIKEIKEKRDKLQSTIAKLLSDFEKETSLKVLNVSYHSGTVNFEDGTCSVYSDCELEVNFR